MKLKETMKVSALTDADISDLNALLQQEYVLEGDLRRQVKRDITRLSLIGAYRGRRHRDRLPVRGQRSRTNARTRKGKVKTVANKKK